MNEQTLRIHIERIEKKFYRTNSDKVRLDELHREINILHSEKHSMANEFKDRQNEAKNKPFCKEVFNSILNGLRHQNSLCVKKRDKITGIKKVAHKAISKERIETMHLEKPIKMKENTFLGTKTNINNNYYENEQLINKLSVLTSDVDTVKKRIISLIEVEDIQTGQLKSIMDKSLFAHFKKLFSFNILKKHQKGFKETASMLESVCEKQQLIIEKNKSVVSKIYDNYAMLNMEIKKLSMEHELVLKEVKELEEKGDENAQLQKNNAIIAEKTELLHKLVEILRENYSDIVIDIGRTTSAIDGSSSDLFEPNYLVSKILRYYGTALHIVDKSHQSLVQLQLHKERKKDLFRELLSSANSQVYEMKTPRQDVTLTTHLENSQQFMNLQKNIGFLIESKNFIVSFSKRIQKIVDTINKVSVMLDFNYQFIIMCPFYTRSKVIQKQRSNADFMSSHLLTEENDLETTQIITMGLINEQSNMGIREQPSRWAPSHNPLAANYNSKLFNNVMTFYEDVLSTFDLFHIYFKQICEECKSDFKQRNISLSHSIRNISRRRNASEKPSMHKQRQTNLKEKHVS